MTKQKKYCKVANMPAPVTGLDDRDPRAHMSRDAAIQLENWWPNIGRIETRGGSYKWVTGLTSAARTLMVYSGNTGNQLFAAYSTGIYDVTSSGALPAASFTISNAVLSHTMFSGLSNNYLVCKGNNSTDYPIFYNGATWTDSNGGSYAPAITGVDSRLFRHVHCWKNRLFFVEVNSLSAWYLGSLAIGGAAAELDFSGLAPRGGYLYYICSIPNSAGSTVDEYIAFITTEGEAIVYAGTDPAVAANFVYVGTYYMGEPIGRKAICRVGEEVLVLTKRGVVSSQQMITADVVTERKTLTDLIGQSLMSDIQDYSAIGGWQLMLAPAKNMLLLNVPTVSWDTSHQWVMNCVTGAWANFTGINGFAFAYMDGDLYCSTTTDIEKVLLNTYGDHGSSGSVGDSIICTVQSAFQTFDYPGLKRFQMARPILSGQIALEPVMNINLDYEDTASVGTPSYTSTLGALWGVDKWGMAVWGAPTVLYHQWDTVNGVGLSVSLLLKVATNGKAIAMSGWDLTFEDGGIM